MILSIFFNVNVIIINIPSVYVDATDIIVEYGLNVTLNCNVTSFPVHFYVYWQRISNGTTTNITSSQAGIHGVSNILPSLIILMIKSADSGLFTCFALNIVGIGYSDVVNLTVTGGKIKHYQFSCCFKIQSCMVSAQMFRKMFVRLIGIGCYFSPNENNRNSVLTINFACKPHLKFDEANYSKLFGIYIKTYIS